MKEFENQDEMKRATLEAILKKSKSLAGTESSGIGSGNIDW